jgi:hypothetical protein
VRAVELPYGERWAYRLPVTEGDQFTLMRNAPAVSGALVALVFAQDPRTRQPRNAPRTRLILLDRTSGLPRDSRDLDEELGSVSDLELAMLGGALLIGGRRQITVLQTVEAQR